MASLDQLLVLQEHDTAIDQLHHRRATLPERAELEGLRRELGTIESELATTQADRDEVARSQKRLEDEVATVEEKVASVHQTLYGGSVTSPRELQALQEDEASLKRHQSAVEDKVIEQMELAVPLDERLAALADRRTHLDAEVDRVAAAMGDAEAAIDLELESVGASAGIGGQHGRSLPADAVRDAPPRARWHRSGPARGHQLRWVPPHPLGRRARPHPTRAG